MAKNYYDILGVHKNASQDDVKKAFHTLAHKYHPDKKGGDENKFKEINEAYQVLGDERKRKEYDTYGRTFSDAERAGGPFRGEWSGGEGGWRDMGDIFGGGADLGDIFGGLGDIFGNVRHGPPRGRDISVDIEISFRDAVFGTERRVILNKVSSCSMCGGKGAKPGSKLVACSSCNGKGRVRESRKSFLGTFVSEHECSVCGGIGKTPETKCATCSGHGVVKKQSETLVSVPPGIDSGEMIKFSGEGEAAPHGAPGDLYVKVYVERDPVFSRDGKNLAMDLQVKLSDAILGAEYTIHTLDGDTALKIPEGVSTGEILRVREKGVPSDSSRRTRGDLLVRITVKTPGKLSRKAKELIEELRREGI